MTTISVTWTAKNAALLDPAKPITTGMKNAEWDNLTFLQEWLGANYLAGAVQNHNHDGLNSAPIEVLPNLVKNGSFELDGGGGIPQGWTFTAYTGGSQAMSATSIHGGKCGAITSTILANGGGYYDSINYIDVGGGESYLWKIWRNASVANISSKADINWYDPTFALISTSNLFNLTNTETTFTYANGMVNAPTNARYAKMRLTGGVPAAGTAVGTVYFDGVMVPDFPAINQLSIQNSAVGQSQLKSAIGSISAYNVINSLQALPGGIYGFYPQVRGSISGAYFASSILCDTADNGAVTYFDTWTSFVARMVITANGTTTVYAQQSYIQASPPYDLGDGLIGQFIFAIINNTTGAIESVYSAPEAPWHNNGPTDIRADFYDASGRGWRWQDVRETTWEPDGMGDYTPRIQTVGREQIEITQAIKQADMPLIPHPFTGNDLTGKTVVILDPVADLTWQLADMHEQGVSPNELLHDDYLRIDNIALNRQGPPGVMVVPCKWKLT